MDIRKQVLQLHQKGMSIKEIAKILGLTYHQVYHLVHYNPKREKKDWRMEYLEKLKRHSLHEKLKKLLTYKEERKGKKVYLRFSEVKERLLPELVIYGIEPLKTTRWYEFLKFFVAYEMKTSWEKFISKRKGKPLPKGSIMREEGLIEVDATGFTFGKNYSVMLSIDTFTGFILSYMVIENKEKDAKHYNKAFDKFDVAKFLQDTFITYGIPKMLKSDNERVIKNEYVKNALERLGIKHIRTIPGQPQQKLIENFIGHIKAYTTGIKTSSINELLDYAVNRWNMSPHKFKHFEKPVIPAEIFKEYDKRREEEIIKAFAIRERRVLRNNTISVNGVLYEFIYPGTVEVETIIYLDDNTKAYLYNAETGEFLGVAYKIARSLGDTVPDESQTRRKVKRIERRKKKLEEQIQKLEREKEETLSEIYKPDDFESVEESSKESILDLAKNIEEEELW